MHVLCVAEKPSIAKSITQILSQGHFQTRDSPSRYNKNYEFDYPQTNSTYTVTSVSGHLTGSDFEERYRKWNSCDAFDLFDAPIDTQITSDSKNIGTNLRNQARNADMVMIWTDCDREGEHIGAEIVKVCRKSNRRIQVKRARFSAIISQQINHAAQNPVELDQAQVDAVDARITLDLKIGSAFTRLQTMTLQRRVNQIDSLVSYGPCQFPTLGFVVRRWTDVQGFRPETFWFIYLALARNTASQGTHEVKFTSRRGHIFDQDVAIAIYEYVLENPLAAVTKFDTKPTKKFKPLPLTTVELQKAGSRLLKLSPKKVLDIAEKLYQNGFLSYPRTETDQFDNQFDLKTLIKKQELSTTWGNFATELDQGGFSQPRKGKHNDKAHPPIHPTAHAGNLAGDEKRVYEFVTRRFLACCSKDAEGLQTTVEVNCGGEEFYATGLTVTARNYLKVYIYDKWSDHEIPHFQVGETFDPSICELRDGQTSSPKYLTEADLVTLMDKNGIGTDATIAQHIATIVDRDYVIERMEGGTKYLVPSTLGIGLIQGYNEVGLEQSLSKPGLRRQTERDMVRICEGTKTKEQMVQEAVMKYKEMFVITRRHFDKVINSVQRYVTGVQNPDAGGRGPRPGPGPGPGGGDRGGAGGDSDDDNGGGGTGGAAPSRRGRGGNHRGGGRGGAPVRSATPIELPSDDEDCMAHPPSTLPTRTAPQPRSRQEIPRPPPSTGKAGTSTSPNGDAPTCQCNEIAIQRTVIKEDSAHKGRQFWRCGTDKDCKYFKWDDELPPAGGQSIPLKRTHSSSQSDQPVRQCGCGDAILRTVTKESGNKGRQFWGCSNEKSNDGTRGCSFFEWADEPLNSGTGTPQSSGRTTSDTCYKCNETGHWANNCPNPEGAGSSKRPKTSGDTNSATCYKCGNSGHFSNNCTTGGSGKAPSRSNSSTTGQGDCFKCGKPGHWSNACPGPNDGDTKSKKSRSSFSKSDRGAKRGGRGAKSRGKSKKINKYAEAVELF